jgi:predicted dehydrogenase
MVDLLRFLFGEADAVYAHTSRRVIHELHADADVPDAGAAVLHMANGMTATLVNSCIGPEPLRVGMEVVTPVALFELAPGSLTVRREHETTVKRPGIDPYTAQDTAFVHAVRSGDRSGIRSDYADALRTHAVSMAIVESARSGSPVVM